MDNIIYMSDHKPSSVVKPKSESRSYKGQRFTLIYQPNVPEPQRWAWHLKYTRVYEFTGSAATIEAAAKAAKRQVDTMEGRSRVSA